MTWPGIGVVPRTLRVRSPGLVPSLLAVGALLLMYAVVVLDDRPGWLQVVFTLLAVCSVASVPLTLRVGVVADPEGLAARTPWGRVRRLRWRDVHHFEVRGHWRDLGACTVDGRWVPMLRYSNFERRSLVELARLEDYRWACQYHLGLVWTSGETGGRER